VPPCRCWVVHTLVAVGAQALDLEKIDSGKFTVEPDWTPVRQLFQDVVDQLGVRAKSNHVRLALDLSGMETPAGVGDGDGQGGWSLPVVGWLDRHRLAQAVLNLGTNAVKFTPHDGSGRVVIQGSIAPLAAPAEVGGCVGVATHELAMRVSDNGVGMSPANVAKLFQPFVQVRRAWG
jgi:signal transduction histidine kinase